ncbi:uncharacterized protein RAG0_04701 [Rhynchosporium agropyri]|uniref:Uncharacterized protein n=1 Tax=Rhynchosporium agropyri TaxID=914238 RepID=A0A1E1K9W5_9HELO|nr:uncharacterized protein RAG0_04701 [Rhynchosporium agropyri]
MKLIHTILSLLGVAVVQGSLLKPYEECLGWKYAYECESGYSCNPCKFDRVLSRPTNVYQIQVLSFHTPSDGFNTFALKVCPYGWDCVVKNEFYHVCEQNADYAPFAISPTPNLPGPESYCGQTAFDRGGPVECVPGCTCSGPGVRACWVCLGTSKAGTSVPVTTSKVSTTSSRTLSTSAKATSKSTTKSPVNLAPTKRIFRSRSRNTKSSS